MKLKKWQLELIIKHVRHYCDQRQCVDCFFSDKIPNYYDNGELTYECPLSIDGNDPWNWDFEAVEIEE